MPIPLRAGPSCTLVAALALACDAEEADHGDYGPVAVLLVIDGVRVEEFSSAAVSELTGVSGREWAPACQGELLPASAWASAAINPGITITAPAHVQMLTGRLDPFANFPVGDAGVGVYRPLYPTLFEEVRAGLGASAAESALVVNSSLLEPTTWSLHVGLGESFGAQQTLLLDEATGAPVGDDAPLLAALQAAVRDHHPRLLVANLHDVDRAGHYGADGTYEDNVQKADGIVAEFWSWLQEYQPGYASRALLALVADHGRHRAPTSDDWRNHGDACNGCREVPFFLAGEGVRIGESGDSPWLIDLAPTFAAHLGVDAPWQEGLPLDDLVADLGATARTGDMNLSIADGHRATQRWIGTGSHRSEVWVDGSRLSTEGATAAEDPVLSTTAEGAVVCFRELDLDPDAALWPWIPRCFLDDAGWAPLDFPEAEVGLAWRPAFVPRADDTLVLYPNNPDGIAELGAEGLYGLRLRTLAQGKWSDPVDWPAPFPTDVSAVAADGSVIVSFATGEPGNEARYTRRLVVLRLGATTPPSVEEILRFDGTAVVGDVARVERSALAADAGSVRLGALVVGSEGIRPVVLTADGAGANWTSPVELPASDPVFGHITPLWAGERLWWAARSADGMAELCGAAPGAAAERCVTTGSARIDSMARVDDATVVVAVDEGVAAWATRELSVE